MSIQSPLGVNRLARTKEVLGITALEAATPVTNGVVTAASYAAAASSVTTETRLIAITNSGEYERSSRAVTDITYGVDAATDSELHDGYSRLVYDDGTQFAFFTLTRLQKSLYLFGGTGVTGDDNTTAIKAALAFMGGVKGDLMVPIGNWEHSEKLIIPDYVNLVGYGKDSKLVSTFVNTPSSSDSVGIHVGNNTEVRNLAFKQKVAATTRKQNSGSQFIFGQSKTNFRIRNVKVENSPAAGMLFQDCSNYKIFDSEVSGTLADGIHNTHGSHHFSVSFCYVHDVGDDAIATVSYDDGIHVQCYRWTFTNNFCKNSGARGISCIGSKQGAISLNHVESCAGGIYVVYEFGYATFDPEKVTVSDNIIEDCGTLSPARHPVYVNDSDSVSVVANEIIDSTDILLKNNTKLKFSYNAVTGYKGTKSGVASQGNTDFEYISNTFDGMYASSMQFSTAENENGLLSSNTFRNGFAGGASGTFADVDFSGVNTNISGIGNKSIDTDGVGPVRYAGTPTDVSIEFLGDDINWLNGFKEYIGVTSLVWNPAINKPRLHIDFHCAASPDQNRSASREYLLYYSTSGIPANHTLVTHEKAVLTFNTGNGTEPIVGETISLGTATGTVTAINVTSGSFAGGDAAGTISVDVTLNAFFAGAATASGGATFTVSSINYAGYKLLSFTAKEVNGGANNLSSVGMTVTGQKPVITWNFVASGNAGIRSTGVAVYG